jgi:flagellar hook-associated protein 2
MSGISGASSSGSSSSGSASTVGTDLAPITFPGIASGIDYNAIINKLTSLTLAPNTLYNNQITQLNAKNAELIKLNNMLTSVQGALQTLSDPATFNSYSGTTTDPTDANVTQASGETATPGSYTITSTQVATSSQVTGGSSAGVTLNVNTALISAGTAITPTNGTTGQTGLFTVDGVAVNYDVNSQSLTTIVGNIYSAVHAVDAGFTISVGTNGAVSIASTDEPISLGSADDRGNLESVLKLDVAEVDNSGTGNPPYSVTSAGGVGGINENTVLNAASSAGFATAVTSGTFTINGVSISVNTATDNVTDILAKINSSTAGVVASYNLTTDRFVLTNTDTGPLGIVVGASSDTSNFLTSAQLTTAKGATSSVGQQAYATVLTASGALQTVYSNSDAIVGAIPGMALNVSGSTTIPFNVTVSQDPTVAINAITNFVSIYNAALNEIAIATAPPVVQQSSGTTTGSTTTSSQLSSGGVLYGDETVQGITDQLTQIVTGLTSTGSTTYNSLQSIGLALDSQHTQYESNTDAYGSTVDTSTSGPIATKTVDGTDGQFLPLDVSNFTAALAADPNAVASLFVSTSLTSTTGITNQIGSYLTQVTGSPTNLVTGLVGTIPPVSLLQADEDGTTAQITALNQSIKNVQDQANAQADQLRQQATASESLIAGYQSEQSYVNQLSSSGS